MLNSPWNLAVRCLGILALTTTLLAAQPDLARADPYVGINLGQPVTFDTSGNETLIITSTMANAIAATGTKDVRFNFRLDPYLNPSLPITDPSNATWTTQQLSIYNTAIANCQAAGLTVLGLLSNESTIANGQTTAPFNGQAAWNANYMSTTLNGTTAANPYVSQYASNAQTLASHFTSIKTWEVWNEANGYTTGSPADPTTAGGTYLAPNIYANLLAMTNNAFSSAGLLANDKLMSGGLFATDSGGTGSSNTATAYMASIYGETNIWSTWRAAHPSGGNYPWQQFGYHMYIGTSGAPLTSAQVGTFVSAVQSEQSANGDSTPMAVTEYGWQSSLATNGPITNSTQAANITTMTNYFKNSAPNYVLGSYLYTYMDPGPNDSNPVDTGSAFGIVTNTGVHKPSYAAFSAAAQAAVTTGPGTDYWASTASSNWDTSTNNWSSTSNGTASKAFANNDAVVFASSGVSPQTSIAVNNAGTNVTPSSITISSAGTYSFTNSSGAIGGSGALSIQGGATVTFNGANVFTGGSTITSGTLILASSTAGGPPITSGPVGTGTILVGNTSGSSNATLYMGAAGSSGSLNIGNAITAQAGGTLTIGGQNTSGTNTYSGNLSLNQSATISETAGGTLALTGNIAPGASGTLTFAPASTAAITLGTGVIGGGTGTLAVTQNGAGTTTSSGTNTYGGVTTISAGVLSVTHLANGGVASGIGQASNAAANLVINGGTLQYSGSGTASTDHNLTATANAGATLDGSGASNAAVTFSNTSPIVTGAGAPVSTNTARNFNLIGSSTGANTFVPAIIDAPGNGSGVNGTTSLVKNGAGTWILGGTSGAESHFTGATMINSGTLKLASVAASVPIVNADFNSGLTFLNSGTIPGWTKLAGNINVNSAGVGSFISATPPGGTTASQFLAFGDNEGVTQNVTFPVTGIYTFKFAIAGAFFSSTTEDFNLDVDGASINGAAPTVSHTAIPENGWVSESITSTLSITAGAHTIKLQGGTNGQVDGLTFLSISGGPATGSLPSSSSVLLAQGATLDLNGVSQTVASLADSGPETTAAVTTSAAGAVTLSLAPTSSTTFSGVIRDGGSGTVALNLLPGSTGTQILAGANTYSGGTTVSGGTLEFDTAPTLSNNNILQVNGGTLRFRVTSGTPSVGTGVTATVAAGATLELAGSVSALGTSATNTTAVTNNSTAAAGGLLVSGTNQQVGTINGTGNVVVNAGSDLTASSVRQNGLTINGTASSFGTVTIRQSGPGGGSVVNNTAYSGNLSSLTIANDGAALGSRTYRGTLNINNNGLVIPYTAGNSPLANVEDMVRAGYDGGHFDQQGLVSSTAAGTPGLNIAVADNAQLQTPFTTFEGQTVSTNSVLVRMTYIDDLTLSGTVSQTDAIIFGANYDNGAAAGHHWWQGDLNHDGKIDQSDAILFGANYNPALPSLDGTTGPGLAFAGGTLNGSLNAVPEPATILLAILGLIGLSFLRRPAANRHI